MKSNYRGLASTKLPKSSVLWTDLENRFAKILAQINYSGMYGYGNDLIPAWSHEHAQLVFNQHGNSSLPRQFKYLYLKGYTFGFSSSLHSHHGYIHISFRNLKDTYIPTIQNIVECTGLDNEGELFYTLRLPKDITGQEVTEVLFGLERHYNARYGSNITVAGDPTYKAQNFVRYGQNLVRMPDFRRAGRRKDLVNRTEIKFITLQRYLSSSVVSFSKLKGDFFPRVHTNSIEWGASPHSDSGESGVKLAGLPASLTERAGAHETVNSKHASDNPVNFDNLGNCSNKLENSFLSLDDNPTLDQFTNNGFSEHSLRSLARTGFEDSAGATEVDLHLVEEPQFPLVDSDSNGENQFDSPLAENVFIYILNVNVWTKLEAIANALFASKSKMEIGQRKSGDKMYPRYMQRSQFLAHCLGWLASKMEGDRLHTKRVTCVIKQVIAKFDIKCKYDIHIQNYCLSYLKDMNILWQGDSYSNFKGNEYSKTYKVDWKQLTDLAKESGWNEFESET